MNTAKHLWVIVGASVLIAAGHDSKAGDFDYKTLPGKWTALSERAGQSFVCEEADKLTVEGDRLTHWDMHGEKKGEYRIVHSYSDTYKSILNILHGETDYPSDFEFVWDDKDKKISFYDGSVGRVFFPDEVLSGFQKIKCRKDDNIQPTRSKTPEDLIRSNETVFEKTSGDLNHDGEDDVVIITKKTWKDMFIKPPNTNRELDRNRRGLLIAFKEKRDFCTFFENHDYFPSENEDGGVYFAPELYVEIIKGNLVIGYAHGRYGGWKYIFRYQNNDFYWIGYEHCGSASYNNGMEVTTSINFVTRKKKISKIKIYDENGDPVFGDDMSTEETWQNIKLPKGLINLTDINNGFGNLYDSQILTDE